MHALSLSVGIHAKRSRHGLALSLVTHIPTLASHTARLVVIINSSVHTVVSILQRSVAHLPVLRRVESLANSASGHALVSAAHQTVLDWGARSGAGLVVHVHDGAGLAAEAAGGGVELAVGVAEFLGAGGAGVWGPLHAVLADKAEWLGIFGAAGAAVGWALGQGGA